MTVAKVQMPENGLFVCKVAEGVALAQGEWCLAELDYGRDLGRVVELDPFDEKAAPGGRLPTFRVLRKERPEDQSQQEANQAAGLKAAQRFRAIVARESHPVKLLHCRFSFDRKRCFIRYSAPVPIDLRHQVEPIERDFKTTVDLWQVGVRDEAAMMGCLGLCGRPVCCSCWYRQFQPVNVKMAKEQEMSLNPISINGCCGKLKCCIRFEYDQYREAAGGLPAHGEWVEGPTPSGTRVRGIVVARDVMRGRVTFQTRDSRFITAPVDELTPVPAPPGKEGHSADARERVPPHSEPERKTP
ncbi:MAG: hypothetical protein J6334_05660 [Kiritimatiellae bacterium]|nr:hypothetical protein [Kiritimatiellia bacterium]